MKILIILASGIGNSILFGPTLSTLRRRFPKAQIDLFAYKKSFAEPFTGSKLINTFFYFSGLKTILALRKQKYDISITAFPSNKWQFNLFAFMVGSKERITHSYKVGMIKTLSFLQNCKVPVDENLHDVEQNLNLLKRLNIPIPKKKEVFFQTTKENEKFANDFIKKNNLKNKRIIGIHAGSGPLSYKRAPLEKFIELINKNQKRNSTILLFGSIEEEKIKEQTHMKINNSIIINSNLKDTASLIKRCNLFITNDTGLMHIASTSKKTRIIALFNGTNYVRTSPWTRNKKLIILRKNKLKYPFYSTRAREE